jgi:hypothetical protein
MYYLDEISLRRNDFAAMAAQSRGVKPWQFTHECD